MRSKRFRPIVQHAQRLEQDAAKALGQAQRGVTDAELRLKQLRDYRQEYAQRFTQQGAQGLSAEQLLDYRSFMEKLNVAIVQQQQNVVRAEQAMHQCRQYWFARRGRSKLLDNVLDRYVQAEVSQASKKEQREMDDRSTRPSWSDD